ncbi:hypothetical protein ACH42_15490 [Endozoicomonas sp. (ex Bugula neritina AB1)]|nr:hypothetical protein ACH42_15490 [Endozoicomonas sp. (ex Bugula neritina AB1)]
MKGLLLVVFKNAPAIAGAFFISLLCATVLYSLPAQAGQCRLDKRFGSVQRVRLDYVIDGDTVRLKDGRSVRLLAINSPEIGQDDKEAEPYGDAAKQALKKLVHSKQELLIQVAGKDHYGRTLGYLFTSEDSLLSASLLNQGLAYQVFMEGSDAYTECLKAAEASARDKQLSLWSQKPINIREKANIHSGFMIINGTVKKISKPKKSEFIWLEMDGDMVVRVPGHIVSQSWLDQIKGKNIEVRGWVKDRRNNGSDNKNAFKKRFKPWMMLIYQTDSVRID